MTFIEKLIKEHPEKINANGCPCDYDYEHHYVCAGIRCEDCWRRTIPGTEDIKEESNMDEFTMDVNETINELKKAQQLNKEEIERLERQAQNDKMAREAYAVYQSLVIAGFTPEQAWEMFMTVAKNSIR